MTDFVTLNCPSCERQLQVGETVEQFACPFCSNQHLVDRGSGIVSLQPVVGGLEEVRIQRLNVEFQALEAMRAAAQRDREAAAIGSRFRYGLLFLVAILAPVAGLLGLNSIMEGRRFGLGLTLLGLAALLFAYLWRVTHRGIDSAKAGFKRMDERSRGRE